MKTNDNRKADIVRIRSGIPAEQLAASLAESSGEPKAGSSADLSEKGASRMPWVSAPYGGSEPIRVRFPWRPVDTLHAYFGLPAGVLVFLMCAAIVVVGVCRGWEEISEKIQADPFPGFALLGVMILLATAGVFVLPGVFVLIWYLRFYRKRERSITVEPATNTFHVSNYVIGGNSFLPAFYPELTFKLDNVEKIVFRSPEMNAFYLVIPEGALLVGGKTAELARLKYYLISEAREKFEQTGRNTLDGAPTLADF